jgi:hypothetical protein
MLMRRSVHIRGENLQGKCKAFDNMRQRIEAKEVHSTQLFWKVQGAGMWKAFKQNWLDIATVAALIVIGLAVLSDVGPAFLSRVAFMSRTVPGAGVIARCESEEVSPFNIQFTPVAQFTAGDGQTYEARGESSSAACVDDSYNRKPVEVRYNPQSPSDAMIGSTTQLIARLTLFTVAGAVAVGVGIIIALQVWKRWPQRKPKPAS